MDEFKKETEQEYTQGENISDTDINDFENEDTDVPVWNRVDCTPVEEIKDYKPMGKGLKVFCIVMAAVILLTSVAAGGYFWGKKTPSCPITIQSGSSRLTALIRATDSFSVTSINTSLQYTFSESELKSS